MKKEYYRIGEFSELIGVSTKTLQRWDEKGKLKANRESNQRIYTHKQYIDFRLSKMNTVFYFDTHSNIESHCKVEINHEKKYIIVTELDTNTGISVTNAWEYLVHEICIAFGLEYKEYIWYEEYERHDICSLVVFNYNELRSKAYDICWACVKKESYGDSSHREKYKFN